MIQLFGSCCPGEFRYRQQRHNVAKVTARKYYFFCYIVRYLMEFVGQVRKKLFHLSSYVLLVLTGITTGQGHGWSLRCLVEFCQSVDRHSVPGTYSKPWTVVLPMMKTQDRSSGTPGTKATSAKITKERFLVGVCMRSPARYATSHRCRVTTN